MKPTTTVYAKMESKGKPELTRDFQGPVRGLIIDFAKWLIESQMGHSMQLTICRSQADLDRITTRGQGAQGAVDSMMADLNALMLASAGTDSNSEEE